MSDNATPEQRMYAIKAIEPIFRNKPSGAVAYLYFGELLSIVAEAIRDAEARVKKPRT